MPCKNELESGFVPATSENIPEVDFGMVHDYCSNPLFASPEIRGSKNASQPEGCEKKPTSSGLSLKRSFSESGKEPISHNLHAPYHGLHDQKDQDSLCSLDNLVLDNAPYHPRKMERLPTYAWRKENIQVSLTPPSAAHHHDHNCLSTSESSNRPPDHSDDPLNAEVLVYCDDNLVSGRLDALVGNMVPTADYYPDRAFLFAFLLASRLFIKPNDLLGQISARCQAEMHGANKGEEPSSHLVRLISEWSETFPYDFRDERVMSHVRKVAHRCVSAEDNNTGAGEVREEISMVLHTLLEKLTRLEQYEAFLHSIRTDSLTSDVQTLSQTETDELCGSAESLAQQLTHIELERLSYIGPEEFVQAFAVQTPLIDPAFKDPRITTNYEVYMEWSTRLKRLVVTDIVRHIKSKKQRVRIVEYWVDTAKECFNIGNFNSLMAIIAGLNTIPISRLKRTWSKSEATEQFAILDNQLGPTENYSSYRTLLRAAAARFNKDDKRLCIVIPIFTLLAKEIHNMCDQCLQKLPNGHINFEKFWQLAKQMTEFITWKQVHCPFPKTAKVITYLQATPVLNDDGALLASFNCEPPQNDQEKELYDRLMSHQTSGTD